MNAHTSGFRSQTPKLECTIQEFGEERSNQNTIYHSKKGNELGRNLNKHFLVFVNLFFRCYTFLFVVNVKSDDFVILSVL